MKSNIQRLILILIAALVGMVEVANAFYDPGLQRWINRDPIGELGFEALRHRGNDSIQIMKALERIEGFDYHEKMNLFCFVHNKPLTLLDRYGLSPFTECMDQCSENFEKGLRDTCPFANRVGAHAAAAGGVIGAIAGAESLPTSIGTAVVFGGVAGAVGWLLPWGATPIDVAAYVLCVSNCPNEGNPLRDVYFGPP